MKDGAVGCAHGRENPHPNIHPDGRVRVGDARLLRPGDEHPEGDHDPVALARDGCGQDAGPALGDEPL